MDKLLDFYEVSADYISFLMRYDSRVPRVDYSATGRHEKFLCGIVLSVGGYNYFAPVSSFKTPQRTNMIINNEDGRAISSIRFSFMIPIPSGVFAVKRIQDEPNQEYRRLLNWELNYCRKNAKTIYRVAKHVYNSVVENKDPLMVKNCCNFGLLETACVEYEKSMISISKEAPESVNADKKNLLKPSLFEELNKMQIKADEHNARLKPTLGKKEPER